MKLSILEFIRRIKKMNDLEYQFGPKKASRKTNVVKGSNPQPVMGKRPIAT